MKEQQKRGNEGKARRLKQHCTAGRLLVLYHHSLTITDASQQRISLDNRCLVHDILSSNLILLYYNPAIYGSLHCLITVSLQDR